MARPLVAYALCRYAGSTQREAAEIMGGCSGVAYTQITADDEKKV